MNSLNSLKLSHRFAVLIAVFALGFAIYGGWSFKTLNDLKVSGPLYLRIVQGKDLVADILPPPEYILESYLVALQLANEADRAEQDKLIEKFESLKGDYDARHAFWGQAGLEPALADALLRQTYDPAVEFYKLAFNELIPAVRRDDRAAVTAAMARLKPAYEAHRQAIDRVVQMANNRNAADEAAAAAEIRSATFLLLAILLVSTLVGIAVAAVIIRGLLAKLGGEPEYAVRIARAIADCDLTIRVETRPGDDSSLLAAMRTMQGSLAAIIGDANSTAERLAQSSTQLSQAAGRFASAAEDQLEATQAMAASMEEISVSIDHIAGNAQETERNTLTAGEMSGQGLLMVNNTTREMDKIADAVSNSSHRIRELGEQSEKISAIVNVIKDIADQTNLLALNAAIEAARAGEQGRGFAVVADEVRKLAERTTQSTLEIGEMIQAIGAQTQHAVAAMGEAHARTDEGVKLVCLVKDSIEKINLSADVVIREVRGMTAALHEQNSAHGQVSGNVMVIAEKTEHVSQDINAIAQAANALATLSTTLQVSVSRFRMA